MAFLTWRNVSDHDEAGLPLGAHIATPRRGYVHHGVYVGDGRVVHYAGLSRGLRRGPVQEVSLQRFVGRLGLWTQMPTTAAFDGAEIVRRARSRVGEDRYHLLTNNCEHFCHWCLRGQARSYQVEARLRAPLEFGVLYQQLLGRMTRRNSSGAPNG